MIVRLVLKGMWSNRGLQVRPQERHCLFLFVLFAHPNPDGSYGGRTIPRFEVADGPLAWLRNSVFVGTLHAHASGDQVDLEFFRVD